LVGISGVAPLRRKSRRMAWLSSPLSANIPAVLRMPIRRDDRIVGRQIMRGVARMVVNCSEARHK